MNRTKLYATLLLALVLAGTASLLVFQKLNQGGPRAPASMIVVAARELGIGVALSSNDVKLVPWSASELPKGAISKVADIEGRGVIYPIAQDEVILESKLAATGAGAGLPSVIPHGMRAVSIRVDDVVAVAGFVGPGTRVDVLLTGSPTSKNEAALTKTILQNVQVLAAGEKIQPDSQGRAEKVNVVTLLCTGQDAAKVTLAANEGRIQLILRNPTDTQSPERAASVGKSALYGETPQPLIRVARVPVKTPVRAPIVAAAPPPPPPAVEKPAPPTVVLIRAGSVTTVQVEERQRETTNQ